MSEHVEVVSPVAAFTVPHLYECAKGCIGIDNPETTVPELVAVAQKVSAWLLRLAKQCDEQAKNNTFESLVEANQADAKNYRAVARDLQTVLAKTGHSEKKTGEQGKDVNGE